MKRLSLALCTALLGPILHAEQPVISGTYPHLAVYNDENECGIGAVVPWAGKLWFVTYAPHKPHGSTDKLYSLTPDLKLSAHPESIGGTPANRMIHRESNQLFLGPYAIDTEGKVRTIPSKTMPGRLTGTARHLTDPANKIYHGTMEEGLYAVDVKTLAVSTLYRDEQVTGSAPLSQLVGDHGKGLYSGQGVLVYSNNGSKGARPLRDPSIPAGCLAEWNGKEWKIVRHGQFTEVTGPGGLRGNANPATDPIWSIGFDRRSLILMVRHEGTWHSYRLPKASHTYDGVHGWHTEWPRIREIGEKDLLMTMHGMLWRFPRTFSPKNTSGLAPRSSYLRVVADFCRWNEHIVFACDDTARSSFKNVRKTKDPLPPTQSHSNLWFVKPEELDQLGPVSARGAVWHNDNVTKGDLSDPMLLEGFLRRSLQLTHAGDRSAVFTIQVGKDDRWNKVQTVLIKPGAVFFIDLAKDFPNASWARLRADSDALGATASFSLSNKDPRGGFPGNITHGLPFPSEKDVTGGIIRPRGENKRTLHYAARQSTPEGPEDLGYYELGADLKLRKVDDPTSHEWLEKNAAIRSGQISVDKASVIVVDEQGRRYRLPKSDTGFDNTGRLGPERLEREVSTERDLFNAHGTFYELPADSAGGFRRIRPLATHGRRIVDFCSYRGHLVLSGVSRKPTGPNHHLIPSDDGKTALWVGSIDDIWKLGRARGNGGPWNRETVEPNVWSDPYLFHGYDRRALTILHNEFNRKIVEFTAEIDLDGNGLWKPYRVFPLVSGNAFTMRIPDEIRGHWIRFKVDRATVATVTLNYN